MRHHYLYVNSPKDIFPQQYGHDHLIENDQYGQSINDQVLEFNGHEMSNESNLEWNGEKSIIGQELQKKFAPKVESKENTDQFSKDGVCLVLWLLKLQYWSFYQIFSYERYLRFNIFLL